MNKKAEPNNAGLAMVLALTLFIFVFAAASYLKESAYKTCVQDAVDIVSTEGRLEIPVVTEEGEAGYMILVPLIPEQDETETT